MKFARIACTATLFAAAIALVNCGDSSPLAPAQAPAAAQIAFSPNSGPGHGGLLECVLEPFAATSFRVGPQGGDIKVGHSRFRVPAGALRTTVTITATQVPGSSTRIHFEPHGLQFAVPATLEIRYDHCRLPPSQHRIAYIDGNDNILEYIESRDDGPHDRVEGHVWHFSDYALAW